MTAHSNTLRGLLVVAAILVVPMAALQQSTVRRAVRPSEAPSASRAPALLPGNAFVPQAPDCNPTTRRVEGTAPDRRVPGSPPDYPWHLDAAVEATLARWATPVELRTGNAPLSDRLARAAADAGLRFRVVALPPDLPALPAGVILDLPFDRLLMAIERYYGLLRISLAHTIDRDGTILFGAAEAVSPLETPALRARRGLASVMTPEPNAGDREDLPVPPGGPSVGESAPPSIAGLVVPRSAPAGGAAGLATAADAGTVQEYLQGLVLKAQATKPDGTRAPAGAGEPALTGAVSFSVEEQRMSRWVEAIRRQTGLDVVADRAVWERAEAIPLPSGPRPLAEVLDYVRALTGLRWQVRDRVLYFF